MMAIRAEMPGVFALFTSIRCFHVGGPPLDFKQEDFDSLPVTCAELLPTSERNFSTFLMQDVLH